MVGVRTAQQQKVNNDGIETATREPGWVQDHPNTRATDFRRESSPRSYFMGEL